MAAGKKAPPPGGRGTLGVPRALLEDVDRFVEQHPEFGIKHRNDFAARAILEYLDGLQAQVYRRMVLQASKDGKIGPTEAARRAGFKAPDES